MFYLLSRRPKRPIYVRFFDVDWKAADNAASPIAPLQFGAPLPHDIKIVPVVYIVNKVFLEIRDENVEELANKRRAISTRSATFKLNEIVLSKRTASATRFRSLGAGAYHKDKQYGQTNYLFSLIFDNFAPLKRSAYLSFHPMEQSECQQTLALARNARSLQTYTSAQNYRATTLITTPSTPPGIDCRSR
jgi:hypothetical protein